MNRAVSRLLAAAVFITAPTFVRSEIVWAGLVNDGRTPRFLLTSTDDKAQQWIALGETFLGFTAKGFAEERREAGEAPR